MKNVSQEKKNRLSQLEKDISCRLIKVKNNLLRLPHNYRMIAAKSNQLLIISLILGLFLTNIFLPTNQAETTRANFLRQNNNQNYHLAMISVLMKKGEFEQAKKELDLISPLSLSSSNQAVWQTNYLFWAQQSELGRAMIINNWQTFLDQYPDYKIGWLYLGLYQAHADQFPAAQQSWQKAEAIDPGLVPLINKLSVNL